MRRTSLRLSSADEAICDAFGERQGIARRVDVMRFALRDAAERAGVDVDALDMQGDTQEWHQEGCSDAEIVLAIKRDYGVDVTPEIVATWVSNTNSS